MAKHQSSLFKIILVLFTCCYQAESVQVYLTVSSLADATETEVTQRQLELNWFDGPFDADDLVGLFDHDPAIDSTNPLEIVSVDNYPANFYRTSVMFNRPDVDSLSFEKQCLGYWIGYIRQSQTIASNCIKIEPNWMWENEAALSSLKYRNTMIPATHDAGSYKYFTGVNSSNIVDRWSVTQEETFPEQLMYGIRDFDLRLAYYPDTDEKFWINHSGIRMHPFAEVVDACQTFLAATNEIVFFDFHQFPVGFDGYPERHQELIDYLIQELGQYLLPPSVGYDVTLGTIWGQNKKLIAAYSDSARNYSDLLWPGIPQIWADTMDGNYLESYMDNEMNQDRTDIWSAQLEFTPSATDVVLTDSSLRMLADEINRNVTEWCRDLWWDKANIVALDFFLGSNIVEVAIESNLKRSAQSV